MKITKKNLPGFGVVLLALSLWLAACKKDVSTSDNPPGSRNVAVYLTDDPCQFDSVFIDIRYVEIKIDTNSRYRDDDDNGENEDDADYDENEDDDRDNDNKHQDKYGKWDTLSIRSGVYNILKLRNGIDTILGTTNIPAGKIRKIRLTLGTNNSVVISGVSHALNLSPGSNNYAYVKIRKEHEDDDFRPGQTSIWLDFNVCKSIKEKNGQYYLKPFLKVFAMNKTGGIEGKVLPNSAQPYVTAWNGTDTASALPEHDGEYKIRGLKSGVYSIQFQGSFGYKDTTLTNVQVQNGQETDIPTITLRQ